MCQYRYYYFGGCQHQETVLFDFCVNASVLAHRHQHPHRQRLPLPTPTPPPCHREAGDADLKDAQPREPKSAHAAASSSDTLSSSSPTLQTTPPASVSTSSIPPRSTRDPSPDPTMAGLAPFATSKLHQIMTRKSMRMADQDDVIETFETLAADIDEMKSEVERLKEEAARDNWSDRGNRAAGSTRKDTRRAESKIPVAHQRPSTTTSTHHGTGTSDGHTKVATSSEISTTQTSTDSDVFTSATATSPRTKNSPRFAQPTMASSGRTGERPRETLRKDSVVDDGSPTRSMRTITQRNSKRPSLPGGWMGSSGLSDIPTKSMLPASPAAVSPAQPLGKRAITYMSPTKATIQRASPRKALPRLTTASSPIKSAFDSASTENAPTVPMAAKTSGQIVANTKRVRRDSTGDLMSPIMAKLEKFGLSRTNEVKSRENIIPPHRRHRTDITTDGSSRCSSVVVITANKPASEAPSLRATAQIFTPQCLRSTGLASDHTILEAIDTLKAPSAFEAQTPIFSPTSDDTSPRHTPSPWTIGASIQARARYGWSGGDGREIRFIGYGPDAERESNPQMYHDSRYNGRNYGHEGGPRMLNADDTVEAPLAPRSRQQWAELMGKVPCGNVEVMQAVEQIPLPGRAGYGFCASCVE